MKRRSASVIGMDEFSDCHCEFHTGLPADPP
jgi:hypothetical protein